MTQRFCEVELFSLEEEWLDIEVQDAEGQLMPDDDAAVEQAGGQSFTAGGQIFTVKWRLFGNVGELMVGGFSNRVKSSNIRITCLHAGLVGDVGVTCSNNELVVMLASSYAVHCVTLDISNHQYGLNTLSSKSYPVATDHPITQLSAIATEDFGVIYSLVNDDGSLIAATVQNDLLEEINLRQTSMLSTIWKKVRSSIVSTVDDGSTAVSSAVSDEHPSIYCLMKNLQLQQWALGTWECVASYNLANYVNSRYNIKARRVKFFSYHPNSLLGVLFTDQNQSKIMLVSISGESGNVGECVLIADCGSNDVVAYVVASDLLFILWRDDSGRYELIHLSLTSGEPQFKKTHLTSPTLPPVELENFDDPREIFTEQIFTTNRLCVSSLLKAIHMLRPTSTTQLTLTSRQRYSVLDLKQMTWDAINNEVRDSVPTAEVTNVEYRELQTEIWHKFYANLIQYHEASMQPLGIVGGTDEVPFSLVRKNCVTYVRPCEPLEQQILFPSEPLDTSAAVNQDVVTIMKSLALLQSSVHGFEDHIYATVLQGEPISNVMEQLTAAITKRADHAVLKSQFSAYLQNTQMLRDGLSVFLHFLNIVNHAPEDIADIELGDDSEEANPFITMNDTGRGIVCSSLRDVAKSRYRLCCALVLFLEYLTELNEEIAQSEDILAVLEELSSTCHALLRAYVVVIWIAKLDTGCQSKAELSTAVLEVLKLSNGDSVDRVLSPVVSTNSTGLLTAFLSGIGGVRVKALLSPAADRGGYYEYLNALIIAATEAVWPETVDTSFPEFLLVNNESTSLQTYCRLLDGHCAVSLCSRMFLLGQTYLLESDPEKAYSCFVSALHQMFDQGGDPDGMRTFSRELEFCYMVLNMFEELCYSEQVLLMAHETLKFADTEQLTLLTKIFKHNLELEHYEEAYQALLNNPDRDRKMDCLHLFLTTLCDKGELGTLASFPYKDSSTQEDLRPTVASILLKKARSVDLTKKNYYDLLYSFHVVSNDLLSAANAMYECCERIRCELSGLNALQKRAKCYLACIHALHCVPSQSAWISPGSLTQYKYISGGKSPKRARDGRNKGRPTGGVQILMLADIEKEYMLVNMCLRLAGNGCKQITGSSQLDASEIVALLCNTGMYDEAIQVCAAYRLGLSSIFGSLTFRCMRMSKESDNDMITDDAEEGKRWLTYNQLPTETSYCSSCDQAWKILRHYLRKHELVSTTYHKVVASKLLANSMPLPEWFIASYKAKNVAELLRIYLQYDLVEEAVDLSAEFLYALTSSKYDNFGLEGPLSATMSPSSVCVPYTSIDVLINALDEHRQDPYYDKLYTKLIDAVEQYTEELEQMSRDAEKRLLVGGSTRPRRSHRTGV